VQSGDKPRSASEPRGKAAKGGRVGQPAPKKPAKQTAKKNEPKGAERRQHRRVAADYPLKIVNEAGREETFQLLDLSECGARIQCGHAVPPMTRIQVALYLPGKGLGLSRDVRVDTTGVIVWSHRLSDTSYDTGVYFPDLPEDQRGMLRALVQAAR
jgi:hypothetical protein